MESLAVQALRDIWAFADLIDFRGGRKSFYQLHYDMADFNCRQQKYTDNKREYRRRLFLVPREHRKSTVNTVLYSLWRIYRNPNITIIVGCCVKDLALDFIREIRQYLEDEDLIQKVWNNRPHIKGPLIPRLTKASSNYKRSYTEADDSKVIWTNWALQVVRDLKDKQPTLQALSVGMSPTGKHCDLIILDDVITWDNSDSEIKAQKVRRWTSDLESVLKKKATKTEICPGFHEFVGNEVVINGTRYYAWDQYSLYVGNSETEQKERLAKTRYSAFIRDVYKNGVDNSDGYLCPEIFDEESERDIIDTEMMSPAMFAAQFRNKIIADEDIMMTQDDIRVVMPDNYRRTSVSNMINFLDQKEQTTNGPRVYSVRVYMVVDLAVSKSTTDKSGYLIGGYDEKHRLHCVASKKGKWKPSEHYEKVYEAAKHWNVSTVWFEGGSGYQSAFKDNFKNWMKVKKLPPLSVHTIVQPRSITKNDRIKNTLQPIFEQLRFCLSGTVYNQGDLVNEIRFFNPISTVNSDDMLDMLEMAARIAKPTVAIKSQKDRDKYRHLTVNTLYGGVR